MKELLVLVQDKTKACSQWSLYTKDVFRSKVSPGKVARKIDGEVAKMTIIIMAMIIKPSHYLLALELVPVSMWVELMSH